MHVLVTWSSKRGGTAGIGQVLADALRARDVEVTACSVADVRGLEAFDAVILGGALYANRWTPGARRFVVRHLRQLRQKPVWFFSSGPLDDSADRGEIPPAPQVAVLADRVGAKGHVTFGGRLEPTASGFPASAMAKTKSGDWRNPERIRAWAAELATILPTATPGVPIESPARSLARLLAYGTIGTLLCVVTLAGLLSVMSATVAFILHGITTPLLFVALARPYFAPRGARDPVPVAVVWTGMATALDLLLVAEVLLPRGFTMVQSLLRISPALTLSFVGIWLTGLFMSMIPRSSHAEGSVQTKAA